MAIKLEICTIGDEIPFDLGPTEATGFRYHYATPEISQAKSNWVKSYLTIWGRINSDFDHEIPVLPPWANTIWTPKNSMTEYYRDVTIEESKLEATIRKIRFSKAHVIEYQEFASDQEGEMGFVLLLGQKMDCLGEVEINGMPVAMPKEKPEPPPMVIEGVNVADGSEEQRLLEKWTKELNWRNILDRIFGRTHFEVQEDIIKKYGKNMVREQSVFYDDNSHGRIDIYNIETNEAYEVKPFYRLEEGAEQLQKYLTAEVFRIDSDYNGENPYQGRQQITGQFTTQDGKWDVYYATDRATGVIGYGARPSKRASAVALAELAKATFMGHGYYIASKLIERAAPNIKKSWDNWRRRSGSGSLVPPTGDPVIDPIGWLKDMFDF